MTAQTARKQDNGGKPAQAPAQNPLVDLQQQITSERMTDQLTMALPEHISVERFQRVVVTAINKSPDLVHADRQSLFTACVEAAQDGLLPNGKEAALVIFNTREKRRGGPDVWVKKVQYMPMIAGIHKKARNTGEIAMLDSHLVYERDHFDYALGLDPHLVHKPHLGDRGTVIAVYAVCKLKDGTPYIEVMTVPEIDEVRAVSKSPDKGPWGSWWGEMARKTAVRRLSKRLPMSSDLERVIQHVDAMYNFDERKETATAPAVARPQRADYLLAPGGDIIDADQPANTEEPESEPYILVNEVGEVVEEVAASGTYAEALIHHIRRITDPKMLATLWENNQAMVDRLRDEEKAEHVDAITGWYDKQTYEITPPAEDEAQESEPEEPTEPEGESEPAAAADDTDSQTAPPEEPATAEQTEAEDVDLSAYEVPLVTKPNSNAVDWVKFFGAFKRKANEVGAEGIPTLRAVNAEALETMQQKSKHNYDALMRHLEQTETAE